MAVFPQQSGLSVLTVIGGAAMLCLPAIANGFPFLFFDTLHYYAAGDKIVSLIAGVFHHAGSAAPVAQTPTGAAVPAEPTHTLFSYIGGRSPYYGVLFFGLDKLFGGWGPAIGQALVGAWLIWIYTKALSIPQRAYFEIIAALTIASALPWTATFLMPDVFGGYAILAAGALAFFWAKLDAKTRIACFIILVAAMAFHAINLLLIIVALPLTLGLLWLFKQRAELKRSGVIFLAAIVLAVIANAAYPVVTEIALGKPLKAPPFLMARLLADGPGRIYLREACATDAPYTACQFKNLPLDDGDSILWSLDPARGIYMASSEDVQHKLIDEQMRFAIGVATHETVPQIGASLRNWYYQLTSFGLGDLSINAAGWRSAADAGAVDRTLMPWLKSPANQGRFPLDLFTMLEQIAFVVALGFLAFRLTRSDFRTADDEKRAFVALTLFATILIVLNAGIAGALSGVFNRYQARIVWVAPLLALLAGVRYGARKRR